MRSGGGYPLYDPSEDLRSEAAAVGSPGVGTEAVEADG